MNIGKELTYTMQRIVQEERRAVEASDLKVYLAHAELAALYRARFGQLCMHRTAAAPMQQAA